MDEEEYFGSLHKVSVRPDSGVYATYQRLSYKPWYAIAEFVDNATQNFYEHRESLIEAYSKDGTQRKLKVDISYDSEKDQLIIHDNANGMEIEELQRAVALNRPPPNRKGRCEYGMGLKTAACWFGRRWSIRTSRLGSNRELFVKISVPELAEKKTESIEVVEKIVDTRAHFTDIKIEGLYKQIRGRTAGRIKEQLGSLYREDFRSNQVEIIWNGAPVSFDEPTFLEESYKNGEKTAWKKNVAFSVPWGGFGEKLEVTGWIGILSPGSQRDAGFVLMRRGRVIVGGPGEGYKPVEIFGQGNTFRSQRLVGELKMDDWPVTQAKDAFDWAGDLEEAFIEELKSRCQDYGEKAEGYRERQKPITLGEMEQAAEPIKRIISTKKFEEAVVEEIQMPLPAKTDKEIQSDSEKLLSVSNGPIQYALNVGTQSWIFRLHWQDQVTDANWMEVAYPQDNIIEIYLNVSNSFFAGFLEDGKYLLLLQKFVIALALAEKLVRTTSRGGSVSPADIRMRMNTVLRRAAQLEEYNGSQ